MLRCRDVCVRCAGGRREMGLLLNGTRGIASRATSTSLGGTQNGLRVYGQSSGITLAVPAVSGLQRGNFSTSTARRISEKELEDLRNQISQKEQLVEREGSDEDARQGGRKQVERPHKPAMSSRALEEELRWLKDPFQMANRVKRMLQKREIDKALELVHRAHREGMECIVAWNLIIDHEMNWKRPDHAFKIYNDMKKRGRRPEAHTYTIMFRGLASNTVSSKSVSRAQSIYESLCSPSSGVKPSTTHNNAVLNVCARHGDMEALWEFAGKLPEEGYGAPDAVTYTIILNALKATTVKDIQGLDRKHQMDGIEAVKAASVREGKRIWADVIKKWREGLVMVDAQLVRAMAQLLLFGARHMDCGDVLPLLNQAMGIQIIGGRREVERQRRAEHLKATTTQDAHAQKNKEFEDIVTEPGASDEKGASELEEKPQLTEEEEFRGLFEPVQLDKIQKKVKLRAGVRSLPELEYPKPTNSELTLIIGACLGMKVAAVRTGREYWRTLTSETGKYKIVPDMHSYSQYLRILRAARASDESLQTLRTMVSRFKSLEKNSYLIAMSTCLRDKNNPNILNIANGMFDLMSSAEAESNPGTLERYVSLVRLFTGSEEGLHSNPDLRFDGFDNTGQNNTELKKAILTKALEQLRPHIQKLKSEVEDDVRPSNKGRVWGKVRICRSGRSVVDADGIMTFLPAARDLYNRILGSDFRELLSKSEVAFYRGESTSLDNLLGRQKRDTKDKTVFVRET